MEYITDFISNLLPTVIHHRNQLKHYRSVIHKFHELFDAASLDIDFSENLSVICKEQPQQLHWNLHQITVHSGILFQNGDKSYHPYLYEDNRHGQKFVNIVINGMIGCRSPLPDFLIVESDNCCSQYKSSEHYYDLQQIADKRYYGNKIFQHCRAWKRQGRPCGRSG